MVAVPCGDLFSGSVVMRYQSSVESDDLEGKEIQQNAILSDGADPPVGQKVFVLAVGGFTVLADSVEGFEGRVCFGNGCECAGAASVGFAVPFLGGAVVTDEGGGVNQVGGDDWFVWDRLGVC